MYEILVPKIIKLYLGLKFFGAKILYKKRTRKPLMKLTADIISGTVRDPLHVHLSGLDAADSEAKTKL